MTRVKSKDKTVKKLLGYIKPHVAFIIIALVCSLFQVVATLFAPVIIGRAVDYIVGKNDVDFEKVILYIILLATSVGAAFLFQYLASYFINVASYRAIGDLRKNAFAKIHAVPVKFIDSHKRGDLLSVIVNDIDQISDGLLQGFQQLFTGIITIIGTLVFMLLQNWLIAVAVVLLTPISLFVAYFIAKGCHDSFANQAKTRGEMSSLLNETVGNQKMIALFDKKDYVEGAFENVNVRMKKYGQDAAFFSALINPCTRFINAVIYLAVAALGAYIVIQGENPIVLGISMSALSVGGLSCTLSYANQYTKPFNEITGVITEVQTALSGAKRVFDLLEEAELPDESALPSPENVRGDMDFSSVCFSYDPARPLIENFNLSVKSGQKIAIVGPTGCGKTTLINLLMRFYDVGSGAILLDGKPIRSFNRDGYRRSFGMVLQDTWIKKGTVFDNISYGKPDATEAEVIEAAKKAHIHSFIMRLPDGYNTVMTEDGGNISQGQKQLLCIARVLLVHPDLLILDEATSSIDTRTELKIQDAFAAATKGKTSFIVAHRLSTIRSSDVILVMKDGNVIEQGNHESLMAKRGFYYNLYSVQFQK
ncbi:MAG: ABC transporter ATP-binding protein [Firmicutes bacterium]|nr:ABC transporter ATP-binding protein [Bacillota bacterium]MDY5531433.1 ABC transporter ATP-binding protein [Pumilibacteraceae bacterium]